MTQPGPFPNVILRIIEEFTDGFLIVDGHGEVVFFNDVFLKLTGWNSSELRARQADILRGAEWCARGESGERPSEILTSRGLQMSSGSPASRSTATAKRFRMVRVRETGHAPQRLRPPLQQRGRCSGFRRPYRPHPGCQSLVLPDDRRGARQGAPDVRRSSLPAAGNSKTRATRLLEAGSLYNSETHIRTADGQLKRVLDTSWVTRDENGAITGYTCQMRDVTYLRNLEQRLGIAERNYIMLFDTFPLFDRDRRPRRRRS